ncbi:HEAT repeat domain-containing protein [Brasilonema bromeliae]|uniref:HEAT repeat domain-containing protein n=1 Tax=Brasilonema bromeliae SPC951 TaxID=385972 RepID=A0ABX1PCT5_9CYAN|nr:HEAT repeat domain-containing protein [Brasilonema bromeliae]NMG22290.1 hypothetical protein [Brasilonema bromeliae SPC951]
MFSKHWKYKIAILTPLVVLQAIFSPSLAQTPSRQLPTAQCTDIEIQKHIQQLNKAERLDFDALVACQSKAVPALIKALTLIKALKNKDENTRIIIIAALGEIGSQATPAVPLLNELLVKDESRDVVRMIDYALIQIEPCLGCLLIRDVKHNTLRYVNNNPPVMCRIPAIRAVLRWKCP